MIKLFSRITKDSAADWLAAYLPNSKIFASKKISGTGFRKLLLGFSRTIQRVQGDLETTWEELDPSTTTNFIEEWESAVGIPDDCFNNIGSIEERRRNVLIKLNSSIQTASDFEDLASLIGLDIEVLAGIDLNILPYAIPFPVIGSEELWPPSVVIGELN